MYLKSYQFEMFVEIIYQIILFSISAIMFVVVFTIFLSIIVSQ